MCSKENENVKKTKSNTASVLHYDPPVYKTNGAGSYIEFRAFDPVTNSLRRKTIKLNHIKGSANRRKYANELLKRINNQLISGWSPWINADTTDLELFETAATKYERHIDKMYSTGLYRKETYVGYKSYLKNMLAYIKDHNPITYMFQFDRKFVSGFLDYIFIERNNGAQTRNNYLGFLKVFSGYLVEKGYLQSRPTDGISSISKKLYSKQREVIPEEVLNRITAYCKKQDPYFLTACYLLYYCFIRPVEMTRLRISNFDLKMCTLTISGEDSKNRKSDTVTIPKKILLHMIDLGIFSRPTQDYLFSKGMQPGATPIDTKIFRDHWQKIRKSLSLDKRWQFYSLKDTGITEMLSNRVANITVRDQARHGSLKTTDIYTPHNVSKHEEIIDYDGSL